VAGEHRHQSEDERQLAIFAAGKVEAHGTLADRFGLGDLGVVGAMVGASFVAQKLPGEDHVLDRDRLAVGEPRRRVEMKGDVAALRVGLDRARDQAIEREGLVVAARHQALDHVATDRRRGDALHDEGIEAVERAEHALHEAPAPGGGGIGIGQPGKARGQRRLAVHGDTVSRFACIGRADGRPAVGAGKGQREGGAQLRAVAEHGAERDKCADDGTAAWAAQDCHNGSNERTLGRLQWKGARSRIVISLPTTRRRYGPIRQMGLYAGGKGLSAGASSRSRRIWCRHSQEVWGDRSGAGGAGER
jgi:hypothetical protein